MRLKTTDPKIAQLLQKELVRQQDVLEMIPSENFASLAVLEALGSIATNKYSEGYPGKRYYGGQEYIDQIETLAIKRAKKLFGAEHANVQSLSGAPANMATYFALLKPGETILAMDLSHGGHLTHGSPVTYLSKIFNFVRYRVDKKTGAFDFDQIRKLAQKEKPKIILCGYSAYSRDIDYKKFKEIAEEVEAYTMADVAHIAGLIAAGLMNNPTPLFDVVTSTTHKTLRGPRGGLILCQQKDRYQKQYRPQSKRNLAQLIDRAVFPGLQGGPHENNIAAKAVCFREASQPEFKTYGQQVLKNAKVLEKIFKENDFEIVFGGTENHLLLLDLTKQGLSGRQAEEALDMAGITVNKNIIPDDPRKPLDPSGIRLGTPALTTRGFKEKEMGIVGQLIVKVIQHWQNEAIKKEVKKQVKELTKKFPLYPQLM